VTRKVESRSGNFGSSHFDADPGLDPTFYFNADPDPDPACHFDVDPDPGPSVQIMSQNLGKLLK
jgi:hypothetical protein